MKTVTRSERIDLYQVLADHAKSSRDKAFYMGIVNALKRGENFKAILNNARSSY